MSQQSSPLPTLTPTPEHGSLILQPNFLPNFPVLYQSLNNPFHSSQGCSCEAWSNPDEPNLTDTIHKFTQTVWENQGSSNRSKVWEPDVFDGSDTRKLWAFLIQCQLNFNSKPQAFQTDASKVNYVSAQRAKEWRCGVSVNVSECAGVRNVIGVLAMIGLNEWKGVESSCIQPDKRARGVNR